MLNDDIEEYKKTFLTFEEYKRTIHLCDSCDNEYPDCDAENINFGTGIGNDNIIYCDQYKRSDDYERIHWQSE